MCVLKLKLATCVCVCVLCVCLCFVCVRVEIGTFGFSKHQNWVTSKNQIKLGNFQKIKSNLETFKKYINSVTSKN